MSLAVPDPFPPPPPSAGSTRTPSTRRALIAGAIVAALVLLAGVAILAVADGGSAAAQPLSLSFTQGQSQTYEIHQTMDAEVSSAVLGHQPVTMDVREVVSWEVVSVAQDGTATIRVTVSEMSGAVNGSPIPVGALPPVEIVVASDGRVVSAGGFALGGAGQTNGFGFPGMSQLTPLLPDHGEAVKVGETWAKEFSQPFPFGEGTISFSATSTYERDETIDGRRAAVVVTEMTVPLDFTLSFAELLDALGPELTGTTGADPTLFEDAEIAYGGQGEVTQTSFLDLEAHELLRTQGSGTFDITMSPSGIPGLDAMSGAEVRFAGSFEQEMMLR